MFSQFNYEGTTDNIVITFTAMQYDQRLATDGSFKRQKLPRIFFYSLNHEKEIVEIPDAFDILKYDPIENEVMYLRSSNPKFNIMSDVPNLICLNKLSTTSSSHTKRWQIALNYEQKDNLLKTTRMKAKSSIVETILHNKGQRVTLVYKEMRCFTFLFDPIQDDSVAEADAQLIFWNEADDLGIVVADNKEDVYIQANLRNSEDE